MTVRKGQDWGTLITPITTMPVVGADAELRRLLLGAREAGDALPTVGLAGGDLMRTLGGTGDRFDSERPRPHLPIDLVRVVADDERETVFAAHLIAARWWWHGQLTAVMNAQFHASFDVAPRSHPNDGRVDIVIAAAELGLHQRWMARSRMRLGTHVPHPLITVRQTSSATLELAERTPLRVDGEKWGSARKLTLTVEPDAFTVCV